MNAARRASFEISPISPTRLMCWLRSLAAMDLRRFRATKSSRYSPRAAASSSSLSPDETLSYGFEGSALWTRA